MRTKNLHFGEKISLSILTNGEYAQTVHQGNNMIIECMDIKYTVEEHHFKINTCYANIIIRETKPNMEMERSFACTLENTLEKREFKTLLLETETIQKRLASNELLINIAEFLRKFVNGALKIIASYMVNSILLLNDDI